MSYKIVGKGADGMSDGNRLVMNELMGSTANEEFERRITASWCGSMSCRLEDSCCENVCFVGSYSLARFEGASGFVGYEVECDGASDNENDDDPEKTGKPM